MSTIHWYQNPTKVRERKRERERESQFKHEKNKTNGTSYSKTTGVKCNNVKKSSEMGEFFFPHRRSSNHTNHQKDN